MRSRWMTIPEFPDYDVSDLGQVASGFGKILKLQVNNGGHTYVPLYKEGVRTTRSLALLVAESFVPRPQLEWNTPIHLDGDFTNCRADNLMWRPRWFAIRYHKQFKKPSFHNDWKIEIVDIETEEVYPSVKDVCTTHGLYWYDVVESCFDEVRVSVTLQEFRFWEQYTKGEDWWRFDPDYGIDSSFL